MVNNEWLDKMLDNKIDKEAMESQGTDKQDHYERKVKAHDWIKGISDLDPVQVEAEYQEKLKQEAMVLGKTAALDDVIADGVTPEEVVNRDYKRDVVSLSDYALAELLAEARGHEKQNTSEMYYELKEKAKAEVASSREKAEKVLLDLIPSHSMLDWQKAFKAFTKDATPAEAKEKDLFKSEVPEKAHDFEHPAEDKFKFPKDPEKAIPGNGREADERTDATKEAGVLQKDIVEGTSKEAALKTEAHCGTCSGDPGVPEKKADATDPVHDDATREQFKQMVDGGGEEILIDLLMRYMPVEEMQGILNDMSDFGSDVTPEAEHYEHAGVPMAVSNLKKYISKKAMGCPVCGSEGKDLKNGQKEHVACQSCGLTYARASLHIDEIKSHASKTEVIKKVAELQKTANESPWVVTTDENGQEVIARVELTTTNVKESEEDKTVELQK